MCQDEDNRTRPIHRARVLQLRARRLEKESRREAWYKSDSPSTLISAPLIISPTAGDLTARLKAVCDKYLKSSDIKVVTRMRAGNPLKRDPKPEPFRRAGCLRDTCLVCREGEPGNCEVNSSGYRIKCIPCLLDGKKAVYEGETGRNPYSRGLEHQDNLRNELEDSPLWKHCTLEHGGEKVKFCMKALRSFKSPMMRQVNEPVRISASRADMLLNSKNEFHQAPLTRLVVLTGLQGDQGEDQGRVFPGDGGGMRHTPSRGRQGQGRGAGGGRGRGVAGGRGRRAPG